MVKFLRKYNKYILVVGGSLLMVAFLMPQAINQLFGNPMRRPHATINGKIITAGDFQEYSNDYHALERFMPALIKRQLGIENADHWMLLVREAEAGGFLGGPADGEDWKAPAFIVAQQIAMENIRKQLPQIPEQYLRQFASEPQSLQQAMPDAERYVAEHRRRVAGELRMTETQFDNALAKARGIQRMYMTFAGAGRLSDFRAYAAKREALDHAVADAVVIPADRYVAAQPEPTEDEVQTHFAKYRELKPADGEFGVGYRLDPRVKLEWLTLDRGVISRAIDVDPIDANKRWRANRAKYPGEFGAEEPRIEQDIRAEKTSQVMLDADKAVRSELKRAAAKLENEKGFKKLPADWSTARPKLEDVAAAAVKSVRESAGVTIPLPAVTIKSAKWLTMQDVYALGAIGQSTYTAGTRRVPFYQLVFQTKELRAAGAEAGDLGVQNGLTSGEIVPADENGNVYYFTVLDSRAESPADTIDDVREQAVADVKKIKAFEAMKADLDRYKGVAATDGLEKLVELVDAEHPAPAPAAVEGQPAPKPPKLTIERRVQFHAKEVRGAQNLDNPQLRDAVRAVAAGLDPTKPVDPATQAQRTLAMPVPKSLNLAVVQVLARRPVTAEEMRAEEIRGGEGVITRLTNEELLKAVGDGDTFRPFTYKSVAARFQYKPEKTDADELAASEPAEAPKKPGA